MGNLTTPMEFLRPTVAALLAIVGTTGGMHAPHLGPAIGLHGLIGALMFWVISMHYRNNYNEEPCGFSIAVGRKNAVRR